MFVSIGKNKLGPRTHFRDTILAPRTTPRITFKVLRESPHTTWVVESSTSSINLNLFICSIASSTFFIDLTKSKYTLQDSSFSKLL